MKALKRKEKGMSLLNPGIKKNYLPTDAKLAKEFIVSEYYKERSQIFQGFKFNW